MDREAAVIRAEMSQTRADLDRKLAQLEERARELSPRRYVREHTPEYLLDRTIGGLLVLAGLKMAWSAWRGRTTRRMRVQAALSSYGRA
jgi:hypothetical protein